MKEVNSDGAVHCVGVEVPDTLDVVIVGAVVVTRGGNVSCALGDQTSTFCLKTVSDIIYLLLLLLLLWITVSVTVFVCCCLTLIVVISYCLLLVVVAVGCCFCCWLLSLLF